CSVMGCKCLSGSERAVEAAEMDAAFDLRLSGPPARPRVLAGLHGLRAGEAADRQIAIGDQRILAQAMAAHIVAEILRVPCRQRVDADARADRLEDREPRPRRRLMALAAGKPARIGLDG